MESPRTRSRILVVTLLLFVTGSALAWNRTYRRATAPAPEVPTDERHMVLVHGGRLVAWDVPPAPVPTPKPKPSPRPKPRPGPAPKPVDDLRKVEVRKGDNLHRVAERALGRSARWREIADLNGLRSPYRIYAGQTLAVPAR